MSEDQLIKSYLNKYEILTKSGKWNSMSLEQDHIVVLKSVTKKLKGRSIKFYKSIILGGKPSNEDKYKTEFQQV